MFETRPRIVHTSTLKRSSCCSCGKRLSFDPAKPYALHLANGPVCPSCAASNPELGDLLRIYDLIEPSDQPAMPSYGIIPTTLTANALCPVYRTPLPKRPYEITSGGKCFGIRAGQERAAVLSAALHRFYGSTAELAPATPPPPTKTPEQVAEERERRERRAHLYRLVGAALGTDDFLRIESFISAIRHINE